MKKSLIMLALLAAAGVSNAQFLGAASQAGSASQAGAASQSGAIGNAIVLEQNVPEVQTINQTATYSTRAEQILSGSTTENSNVHYSGTQTVKNVPSIAMSGPASGPCTGVSGGLGIAGPGWGVGLNGSSVMVDCRLRENVRVIGMAMQSLDGTANPQEKGEATVMFMDALRALSGYTDKLVADEKIVARPRPQPTAK